MSKLKRKFKYYFAALLLIVSTFVVAMAPRMFIHADSGFDPNQYPQGTQYETSNNKIGFDIGNPYFVAKYNCPLKDVTLPNGQVIKAGTFKKGQIIPPSDWQYVDSPYQTIQTNNSNPILDDQEPAVPVWNWKLANPNQTIPAGTTVQIPLTANTQYTGELPGTSGGPNNSYVIKSNIMYDGHVVGTVVFKPNQKYGTMTFNNYFESHHITHISGQIQGDGALSITGTGKPY